MNQETKPRDLARDTRDGKEGEVMAEPGQFGHNCYWLRPIGGGYEYQVPQEYVEIVKSAAGVSK